MLAPPLGQSLFTARKEVASGFLLPMDATRIITGCYTWGVHEALRATGITASVGRRGLWQVKYGGEVVDRKQNCYEIV